MSQQIGKTDAKADAKADVETKQSQSIQTKQSQSIQIRYQVSMNYGSTCMCGALDLNDKTFFILYYAQWASHDEQNIQFSGSFVENTKNKFHLLVKNIEYNGKTFEYNAELEDEDQDYFDLYVFDQEMKFYANDREYDALKEATCDQAIVNINNTYNALLHWGNTYFHLYDPQMKTFDTLQSLKCHVSINC